MMWQVFQGLLLPFCFSSSPLLCQGNKTPRLFNSMVFALSNLLQQVSDDELYTTWWRLKSWAFFLIIRRWTLVVLVQRVRDWFVNLGSPGCPNTKKQRPAGSSIRFHRVPVRPSKSTKRKQSRCGGEETSSNQPIIGGCIYHMGCGRTWTAAATAGYWRLRVHGSPLTLLARPSLHESFLLLWILSCISFCKTTPALRVSAVRCIR